MGGAAFYPGRGVKFDVWITNEGQTTIPWTVHAATGIELVGDDGASYRPSEIGGTLAHSVPTGLPPKEGFEGWFVFPVDEFGTYVLRYPDQPDVSLDLTPEYYDASRKEFLQNPRY